MWFGNAGMHFEFRRASFTGLWSSPEDGSRILGEKGNDLFLPISGVIHGILAHDTRNLPRGAPSSST